MQFNDHLQPPYHTVTRLASSINDSRRTLIMKTFHVSHFFISDFLPSKRHLPYAYAESSAKVKHTLYQSQGKVHSIFNHCSILWRADLGGFLRQRWERVSKITRTLLHRSIKTIHLILKLTITLSLFKSHLLLQWKWIIIVVIQTIANPHGGGDRQGLLRLMYPTKRWQQ